jgi:hypothetical protein
VPDQEALGRGDRAHRAAAFARRRGRRRSRFWHPGQK